MSKLYIKFRRMLDTDANGFTGIETRSKTFDRVDANAVARIMDEGIGCRFRIPGEHAERAVTHWVGNATVERIVDGLHEAGINLTAPFENAWLEEATLVR